MVHILAENCHFNATMKKWTAEFKQGKDNTDDDPWLGRQKISSSHKQFDAIYWLILYAGRLTVTQIDSLLDRH